jgi:hypothetical protein
MKAKEYRKILSMATLVALAVYADANFKKNCRPGRGLLKTFEYFAQAKLF